MIATKNYLKAQSLEQAYQVLTEKRSNKIIGGMLWLRQSRQYVNTMIDLKDLDLDKIQDTGSAIELGAMVTLRQIETSPLIRQYFPGLAKSTEHIVGVQFRNLATIGGSVFSRFGFSNLVTALLPLDVEVKLFQGGSVSLEAFNQMPMKKDILVSISIKKNAVASYHHSLHHSSADFPIITVGAACVADEVRIAIGARPRRPILWRFRKEGLDIGQVLTTINEGTRYGTNSRGGAQYRKQMADVLIRQYLEEQL